jgi:hypothetical protein
VIHRHACSCGDFYLCKMRDCVPGSYEQCPECAAQQERETARQRAKKMRLTHTPTLTQTGAAQ